MLIDPRELIVGAVAPGLEGLFRDWRNITVPESPNYRFLRGDEIPYRLLMYQESGRDRIQGRVERFRRLVDDIERTGRIDAITIMKRPDGRYMIKNGNHRAAIAAYLGLREIQANVWPIERLLEQIGELSREDPDYYGRWVGPMRRAIAMVGA